MTESRGPYDNVLVGTMLFTLVEPHRGHHVSYNRWYERDHFYAGCLIGPGWFSGRRWVATAPDKADRLVDDHGFLPDPRSGSYLATYWIERGADAEAIAWGSTQVRALHEQGRMFAHRDHVHTLMYVHRFAVDRDPDPVPTALALDHPFASLLVASVERSPEVEPRAFTAWLANEALPPVLQDSRLAKVVGFTPIPLPPEAPVDQPRAPAEDRRVLLLGFAEAAPEECDAERRSLAEAVRAAGHTASWVGSFRPTICGTDTYTDQLW